MQAVSAPLRTALAAPVRGALAVQLTCDVGDTTAAADAAAQDTGRMAYAGAPLLARSISAPPAYASFEPQRMVLGARQRIAPQAGQAAALACGFVSSAICDANGRFTAAPCVCFTFMQKHSVPALTLCFGTQSDCLPAAVTVAAYSGSVLLSTKQYVPNAITFTAENALDGFDKLEISFTSMAAGLHRARLVSVLFGYSAVFGAQAISDMHIKWQRDPLMRSLPTEKLQCTVAVYNTLTGGQNAAQYNPDNPAGVWRYLEQPCPVDARCALPTAEGVQWVELGRYYLNGKPAADNMGVQLTAEGILAYLDAVYTDETYTGTPRTLLALAQAVLAQARLPAPPGGGAPYSLWAGLGSITTAAPLPAKPLRQCLQYIAHAAGCMVYTGRDGVVYLQPPQTQLCGEHCGYDTLLEAPAVSKVAPLGAVQCKVYTYAQAENGTWGSTTQLYTAAVENSTDIDAATETVDNPLITDDTLAAGVCARTAAYLAQRVTYTAAYRGHPALDAGDIITLQTAFSAAAPVRVLTQELSLGSGLSGTLVVKKLAEEA